MESMELKPCPFCGGEAKLIWENGIAWVTCTLCGIHSGVCLTKRKVAEVWNRRYEPPNPPLTLDELREMGGEPVWCVDGMMNQCWCLVNCDDDLPCCYDNETGLWDGCFYGMEETGKHSLHPIGWLAYRRRPKEETV